MYWRIACIALCFFMGKFSCFGRELNQVLHEFEEYAVKSLRDWHAVGMAIAIVKDGKVVYIKGLGQRSLEDTRPVDEETLFQIGSITKSFTATLTAIAVDREHFQWSDAIIDHLPNFLLYDPWVTRQFEIEDLYAQRSGLPAYAGDMQALLYFSPDTMIHNLRDFPPISSFRSEFAYQNIFFSVGAKILSLKTGSTWNALIEDEIFKPLEMQSSSSTLNAYLKADNRVGWHLRQENGNVIQIPDTFESADWIYIYGPAGGINSTIKDMAQWLIVQTSQGTFKGKQIISKDNLQRTWQPHVYMADFFGVKNYYCLGWAYCEYSPFPVIWHNGATSGTANMCAFIPEDRLGIVILCNTAQAPVSEFLAFKFFDLFYDHASRDWSKEVFDSMQKNREVQSKPQSPSLPAQPLNVYTGTYHNGVYGDAKVVVHENGLQIELGPKPSIWRLKHLSKDAFSYSLLYEGEESNVYFEFEVENRPVRFVIEKLQENGAGTFNRVSD